MEYFKYKIGDIELFLKQLGIRFDCLTYSKDAYTDVVSYYTRKEDDFGKPLDIYMLVQTPDLDYIHCKIKITEFEFFLQTPLGETKDYTFRWNKFLLEKYKNKYVDYLDENLSNFEQPLLNIDESSNYTQTIEQFKKNSDIQRHNEKVRIVRCMLEDYKIERNKNTKNDGFTFMD